MTERILVPLTDSNHAWPGLEYALELYPETDVTVISPRRTVPTERAVTTLEHVTR